MLSCQCDFNGTKIVDLQNFFSMNNATSYSLISAAIEVLLIGIRQSDVAKKFRC